MLVDVVRMRRHGAKLGADIIKAADPTRGHLRIYSSERGTNLERCCATLTALPEPTVDTLIPDLERARVCRLDARGWLIVGIEQVFTRRMTDRYPQAWWCRPIPLDGKWPYSPIRK